jgi:hypothetical protein
MVAIIIFICHPSRFDKFWDEMHNELINELRNIPVPSTPPAPGINVPRTYLYQDSVLYEMKRYPSVKFVDDPVTMKRTITVIEDLAWVLPVKGGRRRNLPRRESLRVRGGGQFDSPEAGVGKQPGSENWESYQERRIGSTAII